MDKNARSEPKARDGITGTIRLELEKRKNEPKLLFYDIAFFALTFVFSRFHFLFGSYPLAISFLAAAPTRVWVLLLGALVGSITRGELGVIHAIINLIVVFLRVIISGGDSKAGEKREIFSEPLALRASAAVIGAFIGAVYELLLGGLSATSILYGVAACAFSALFTVAFFGLFTADVGISEIIFAKAPVFEKKRRGKAQYEWIYFQVSFLILIFFLSLSLMEYTILGIDLALVFSGFISLVAAKRFGATRALVIGFVSSFGVSATYSVSFALLGFGAGIFFQVAPLYAFLAGGGMLAAWSAYSGGLVGFLSTFPEFASSAALFFPLLKILDREKKEEVRESTKKCAQDMITSVALSKRNERGGGVDKLTASVGAMAGAVRRLGKSDAEITRDELSNTMIKATRSSCSSCENFEACKEINPAPCAEIIDDLTTSIYKNKRISHFDEKFFPDYCQNREHLFEGFSSAVGGLLSEKFKCQKLSLISDEYELLCKMINEARLSEEEEWHFDKELSARLDEILFENGIKDGVAKVFGERKKRFIVAGEDRLGDIISSKELMRSIEKAAGVKLGTPEFFRKGDIALMNALAAPAFSVKYAKSSISAPSSDISGDTAASFVSEDGYFYSLISDGMGTGELAREISLFVFDFLKNMLSSSISENTVLGVLNNIIRNKNGESSATLDLFSFDLLYGEASFIKSGAVSSYVKRGSSLFRIRSETAPLGLMKSVDAEKIRVEIKDGDTVIMISDGVADLPESSAWLPELLSRDFDGTLQEYSDYILKEAARNSAYRDDMTVSLARISRLE